MASAALRHHYEQVVQNSMAVFGYTTAAFYADKLVALCGGLPVHVHALATAYYQSGDAARALLTLRRYRVLPRPPAARGGEPEDTPPLVDAVHDVTRCILLAALCTEKLKKPADALDLLSCFDIDLWDYGGKQWCHWPLMFDAVKTAVYCCAGRCQQALERKGSALKSFQSALKADPFCYEAFDHIMTSCLVKSGPLGEQEMIAELPFPQNSVGEVTRHLYECQLSWSLPVVAPDEQHASDLAAFADLFDEDDAECSGCSLVLTPETYIGPVLGWGIDYTLLCRAARLYNMHFTHAAVTCAERVYKRDPYNKRAVVLYAVSLVALGRRMKLFELSHKISASEQSAHTSFVLGCYHYSTGDFEKAGQSFSLAIQRDRFFVEAWMAYGHVYNALEECEHTMHVYRNCKRLAPGLHLPTMYLAMEHAKSANNHHAYTFLMEAKDRIGTDPILCNEMGVVMYKSGHYEAAERHFRAALQNSPARRWVAGSQTGGAPAAWSGYEGMLAAVDMPAAAAVIRDSYWEPCIFNLGHALRKLRKYREALRCYSIALAVRPQSVAIITAIGFTHHLLLELDEAIECYHKALSIQNTDHFCRDMLERAFEESFRLARSERGSASDSMGACARSGRHALEFRGHRADAGLDSPAAPQARGPVDGVWEDSEPSPG